jgi:hypothetical protein
MNGNNYGKIEESNSEDLCHTKVIYNENKKIKASRKY